MKYLTTPWQDAPLPTPEKSVMFAIGDIHGNAELLSGLHQMIRNELIACAGMKRHVVWLGDYIDRGPESLEVLSLVQQGLGVSGVDEHKLVGNHDQYLIEFLNFKTIDRDFIRNWLDNGGLYTWNNLDERIYSTYMTSPGAAQQLVRQCLGSVVEFLESLKIYWRCGNYIFVHAGIEPGVALEDQELANLLLIREPFLTGKDWPHDFIVVHGHTPQQPAVHGHRISVDSGVYFTDALTAVELKDNRVRFHVVAGTNFDPNGKYFSAIQPASVSEIACV